MENEAEASSSRLLFGFGKVESSKLDGSMPVLGKEGKRDKTSTVVIRGHSKRTPCDVTVGSLANMVSVWSAFLDILLQHTHTCTHTHTHTHNNTVTNLVVHNTATKYDSGHA